MVEGVCRGELGGINSNYSINKLWGHFPLKTHSTQQVHFKLPKIKQRLGTP
jgi:hypothetical protein